MFIWINTDLLTYLENDINVEHTKAHFIYANKMGEKYLKRYKKYFHDPDIREFDMQHEQWLLGEKRYAEQERLEEIQRIEEEERKRRARGERPSLRARLAAKKAIVAANGASHQRETQRQAQNEAVVSQRDIGFSID